MASAVEQLAKNANWGTLARATELKQRILFVLGALIVALEKWGRDKCEGDLSALSAESLALLRSGLAPLN